MAAACRQDLTSRDVEVPASFPLQIPPGEQPGWQGGPISWRHACIGLALACLTQSVPSRPSASAWRTKPKPSVAQHEAWVTSIDLAWDHHGHGWRTKSPVPPGPSEAVGCRIREARGPVSRARRATSGPWTFSPCGQVTGGQRIRRKDLGLGRREPGTEADPGEAQGLGALSCTSPPTGASWPVRERTAPSSSGTASPGPRNVRFPHMKPPFTRSPSLPMAPNWPPLRSTRASSCGAERKRRGSGRNAESAEAETEEASDDAEPTEAEGQGRSQGRSRSRSGRENGRGEAGRRKRKRPKLTKRPKPRRTRKKQTDAEADSGKPRRKRKPRQKPKPRRKPAPKGPELVKFVGP
jgi:hypothetical protein